MLRVGVSGWSHADWVGPFYPVALRDRPDAWLAHCATRFRSVEITSTFDAEPDADLVAAWCRAGTALHAAGPFEFSLKLPREATHDALLAGDVHRAWEVAARFERHVLDPLSDEALLGAVLVQLPPAVAPDPARVDALREMLAALSGRRIAIEPRHPAWERDGRLAREAEPLFRGSDVALVEVDAPSFPRVPSPRARHAYVRFHGRRADLWRTSEAVDGARYDYLYDARELAPWAERLRALEAEDREVRAYFNNARGAKSVANAVEMLHLLGKAENVPRPRLTAQRRLPVQFPGAGTGVGTKRS